MHTINVIGTLDIGKTTLEDITKNIIPDSANDQIPESKKDREEAHRTFKKLFHRIDDRIEKLTLSTEKNIS